MAVEIIADTERERAVMVCTTSDWAFGPIFESREQAEAFLSWLANDPRNYGDSELNNHYGEFIDEWNYCGLSKDEIKQFDLLEHKHCVRTIGLTERAEYRALESKIEDARSEKWDV